MKDKAAKGKVEDGEFEQLAQHIALYKEKIPLRLYVDDVTTEKLTSVRRTAVAKRQSYPPRAVSSICSPESTAKTSISTSC